MKTEQFPRVGITVAFNDTLKSLRKKYFLNDFVQTFITLWHGDYDLH